MVILCSHFELVKWGLSFRKIRIYFIRFGIFLGTEMELTLWSTIMTVSDLPKVFLLFPEYGDIQLRKLNVCSGFMGNRGV